MVIAVSTLANMHHGDFGVLQWSLAVVAVLLVGWVFAMLLNIAIFTPIYWLLGRLQSKKDKTEPSHNHEV